VDGIDLPPLSAQINMTRIRDIFNSRLCVQELEISAKELKICVIDLEISLIQLKISLIL
jgi:hypothetical protein